MFESPWHWAVVIAVAFVLFFGWKQLPDMARSLGRSMRVLKTEIKGMGEDDKARETARDAAKAEPPAIEAPRITPSAPSAPPAAQAPAARPRPRPATGNAGPASPVSRDAGAQQ